MNVLEYPEHGIVINASGAVCIAAIAETGLDHLRIKMLVQLLLALNVLPFAALYQYVKWCFQELMEGLKLSLCNINWFG